MALVTSTDEIRQFVNIARDTDFNNFSDDFLVVEEKEVAQNLGQAQYDALVQAYQNPPINDEPTANLLAHCQRIIVNLGLGYNVDFLELTISDSGLQRMETDTYKTAFHYQKLELQNYLFRKGFAAVESLLKYLEKNKDTFTDWRDSDAYTIQRNLFIESANRFQQYFNIAYSRRFYQNVKALLQRIEDFHIKDVIGLQFYDELKSKLKSASPNFTNEEQYLVDKYIRPAIVHLTVAEAVQELPLRMTEGGLELHTQMATGQGTVQKTSASTDQVALVAENAAGVGRAYVTKMVEYLNATASASVFPTFYASSLYAGSSTGPPKTDGGIYNAFG